MGKNASHMQEREESSVKTNGKRLDWGVVIHGGVGVLPPEKLTAELKKAYLECLRASVSAGYEVLNDGRGAVASVVAAIEVMEDSDLFNAGRGSNLDSDGAVSMDASLMVGDTLEAGAVAGVRTVRNPIRLARAVMEHSAYVMISGPGADAFARTRGLAIEDPDFFFTQRRWDDLQAAKSKESNPDAAPNTVDQPEFGLPAEGPSAPPTDSGQVGTVGAVALDQDGLLVAGTSTGGSANKKWGRIGDSPVIGAGTYAGSHCAVSCTGWGEYFIRNAVAHDIQARMAYAGRSLAEASADVIHGALEAQRRGLGGIVALDREGNVEMAFSTRGMYRGWVDETGRIEVAILG
jgi:beta-aspartyl-peptidase (threonine type)